MDYQINKSILDKTKDCIFSFKCLDDNTRDMCKVSIYLEQDGCILKKPNDSKCPYKQWIRESTCTCNCPTRHEFFKKYNI